jgi:hypothetical protein
VATNESAIKLFYLLLLSFLKLLEEAGEDLLRYIRETFFTIS